MADPIIKIAMPVEVDATLTLTYKDPKTGKDVSRPVTADDLKRLRLRHENDMYEATHRNVAAIGLDDNEGLGSQLRYFVEHTTHWDGVHDLNPSDFIDLRAALGASSSDDIGTPAPEPHG